MEFHGNCSCCPHSNLSNAFLRSCCRVCARNLYEHHIIVTAIKRCRGQHPLFCLPSGSENYYISKLITNPDESALIGANRFIGNSPSLRHNSPRNDLEKGLPHSQQTPFNFEYAVIDFATIPYKPARQHFQITPDGKAFVIVLLCLSTHI